MTNEIIDFGVRIEYEQSSVYPDINANLDQYLTLQMFTGTESWITKDGKLTREKTKRVIDLIPCDRERFGVESNETDYLGIGTSFFCPDIVNFTL